VFYEEGNPEGLLLDDLDLASWLDLHRYYEMSNNPDLPV